MSVLCVLPKVLLDAFVQLLIDNRTDSVSRLNDSAGRDTVMNINYLRVRPLAKV